MLKYDEYLKANTIFKNLLAGAFSGAFTGLIIGPTEALKVYCQAHQVNLQGALKSKTTVLSLGKDLVKMTPSFAFNFSIVCALEFSVNEELKKINSMLGISASAFTAALFLTAGDHLMLRKTLHQQKFNDSMRYFYSIGMHKIFTGLSPMMVREMFFIASVMYIGPYIGKRLHNQIDPSHQEASFSVKEDTTYLQWSAAGRMMGGMLTTLFSQPFDTAARQMQLNLDGKVNQHPRFISTLKKMSYQQMFRGAVPRIGLASVGGTLAGTFFDYAEHHLFKNSL